MTAFATCPDWCEAKAEHLATLANASLGDWVAVTHKSVVGRIVVEGFGQHLQVEIGQAVDFERGKVDPIHIYVHGDPLEELSATNARKLARMITIAADRLETLQALPEGPLLAGPGRRGHLSAVVDSSPAV